MYEYGVISNPVFSFYFYNSNFNSYLDFGNIDYSVMKDPTNLKMISTLPACYFWSAKLQGIRFGDSEPYALASDDQAILDSGTTCLFVPQKYFYWLLDNLSKDYGLKY